MADSDPLSPLKATAAAMHEWFVTLVAAGFSEEQALRILVVSMTANHGEGE